MFNNKFVLVIFENGNKPTHYFENAKVKIIMSILPFLHKLNLDKLKVK